MADIIQTLGFDVTQAIKAVEDFNKSLETMNNRLQDIIKVGKEFNDVGRQNATNFGEIAKKAGAAAKAIDAFNTAQKNSQNNQGPNPNQNFTATAAASGGPGQLLPGASQFIAFGGSNSPLNTATQNVTQQTQQMGAALTAAANNAQTQSERITTSLGLLNRIVFTQLVIKGLRQLQTAFVNATESAVEFQKQVALSSAIDETGQSVQKLGRDARQLSDSFNLPVMDVAKAQFEVLQRDIGKTGDETNKFIGTAAEFARSTGSTLVDSVKLLDASLKSFGQGVNFADRNASIFNQTIVKGNVTASELADSFGRIGPILAQAGGTLEDFGAVMATITLRGSDTSEALTQFRAILTALLSPSKGMKEAFRALEVSSGAALIQANGLSGAFAKLAEHFRNDPAAMKAAFENVRGFAGAASLTADNLELFGKQLQNIGVVASDFNHKQYLKIIGNDAETTTAALNKLANIMLESGEAILKFGADTLESIGGIDKWLEVIKTGVGLVDNLSLAIIGITGSTRIAALAFGTATGQVLAFIFAVKAAIDIGKSLGKLFENIIAQNALSGLNQLIVDQTQRSAAAIANFQKEVEEQGRKDQETTKKFVQGQKVYEDAYNNRARLAKDANTALVQSTTNAVGQIVTVYQRIGKAIDEARQRLIEFQRQSQNRQLDSLLAIDEARFKKTQIGLNDSAKFASQLARGATLAGRAFKQFVESGGQVDKVQRALSLFGEAEREIQAASGPAGENLGKQQAIQDELIRMSGLRLRAEQQLNSTMASQTGFQNKSSQQVTKLIAQAQGLGKQYRANVGVLDAQGKQLSENQLKTRAANRENIKNSLVELARQLSPEDLKKAGLDPALVQSLVEQATRKPTELNLSVENESQRIQDELTNAFLDYKLKIQLEFGITPEQIQAVTGLLPQTPEELIRGVSQLTDKITELQTKLGTFQQTKNRIADLNEQADLLEKTTLPNLIKTLRQSDQQTFSDEANKILESFKRIRADGKITAEEFDEVKKSVDIFSESLSQRGGLGGAGPFTGVGAKLAAELEILRQLQIEQQKEAKESPQLQSIDSQLQGIRGIIDNIGAKTAENIQATANGLDQSSNALQTVAVPASQTMSDNANTAANALVMAAIAWQTAAQATFNLPAAAPPAPIQGPNQFLEPGQQIAWFGRRMQYFQNGGFARGMDQNMVAVADGESIINARDSQRFFSQIQSMNAHRQPSFKEQSTQTNIGDVHINVQGGGPVSAATARQLAREFQRELRRTTSRL